jgi:hypothetical protein
MEKEEASYLIREDYVECYDRRTNEWYEVPLPGGPYAMELEHVMFWDMNQDGMIDFAVRKEDGSWNLLTFIEE